MIIKFIERFNVENKLCLQNWFRFLNNFIYYYKKLPLYLKEFSFQLLRRTLEKGGDSDLLDYVNETIYLIIVHKNDQTTLEKLIDYEILQ